MVCCPIAQFISSLVEKTIENFCNLESIYVVYGDDAITRSEKFIGVTGPLMMNENNADFHRAEESKYPKLHTIH